MNLITIGSYTPAENPTKYDVDIQDIDSSDTGRGETGYMNRERVRENVYKISLGFTNIPSDMVAALKEALAPDSISVTFFDGSSVTADMYVGNRTLKLKSVDDMCNCYWDMDFSLTQF